jgi:hypothetical protein
MPILEKHIIQKVTVEVVTHSMESAEFLKENLSAFLEEEVFPFIERYLERYDDQVLTDSLLFELISLDIVIDNITSNQWDKAFFLHLLSKQLDKKLNEVVSSTSTVYGVRKNRFLKPFDTAKAKSVTETSAEDGSERNFHWLKKEEKAFLSLIYFLDHGELPWWVSSERELRKLDGKLLDGWDTLTELKQQLLTSLSVYQVRVRFILQYSPEEIIRVISFLPIRKFKSREVFAIAGNYILNVPLAEARIMVWFLLELVGDGEGKNQIYNSIKPVPPIFFKSSFRNDKAETNLVGFAKIIRKFLTVNQGKTLGAFLRHVRNSIKLNEFPNDPGQVRVSVSERITADKYNNISARKFLKDNSEKSDESKVLPNAGIILLHPFLGSFFTDCEVLAKNNDFLDPDLAVHLLHYAATGEELVPDYALQFEKFLIGIPPEIPIDRYISINQIQKKKVENLLDSLLENWPKLKNTSADTVRVEFLQRSGKIHLEGDTLRIIMDRKVQDVLLDGLPFNLGMVKLPWRKELIFVEW